PPSCNVRRANRRGPAHPFISRVCRGLRRLRPRGLLRCALMEDGPEALGVVVEADRGSLPFALLHGEPLVACAAWAMGEAGVYLVDATTPWDAVVDIDLPLVWHDALCPMTPPDFIAACVRRAVDEDVVVAGVHPVTDTVKEVVRGADGPVVGPTHDRETLRRLASPLV